MTAQLRTALCYRVETDGGTGMYRTGFGNELREYVCRDGEWGAEDRFHPPPGQDTGLTAWHEARAQSSHSRYHFGFGSMEQLRRWLFADDLIKRMPEYGLRVHIYQCKEYCIGDTQMVFVKRTAEHIGAFTLD